MKNEHTVIATHNLLRCAVQAGTLACAKAEVTHSSAIKIKQTAVDLESTLLYRLLDDSICHESLDTGLNVQLGDAYGAGFVIANGSKLFRVCDTQGFEWCEPCVKHATDARVTESSCSTATAGVTTKEDIFDSKMDDGVLDNSRGVDVRGRDNICNIAVNKNITRLETENGRLWAAGIRAAKPDYDGY